ncbi:MAG: hypothetical protein K2N50_04235 [Clostridia bacterium]|nr:hypothetical protein [Clostridia bacterium]
MQVIDWIAIGVVLVSVLFGVLFGFGKLLKFFTGGILGIIISVVVTYFCFGIVSSWVFVRDLMSKLLTAMQNANSPIVDFLLKIGIEKIILAVGIFIIVQILRIIIVRIIKGIVEIDNPVTKVINKLFGIVFMLAVACMVCLLVFHVIQLVGGETLNNVRADINGSVFKLDWVFDHNPLLWIIKRATAS